MSKSTKTAIRQIIEAEMAVGHVSTLAERLEASIIFQIKAVHLLKAHAADLRQSGAMDNLCIEITQSRVVHIPFFSNET